jgi:Amt family ammonium transporter
MNSGKFWRVLSVLIVIALLILGSINYSRSKDPCRIGLDGKYDPVGLTHWVEDALDKNLPLSYGESVFVAQLGCTVILKGRVSNESIKTQTIDIAKNVEIVSDRGIVFRNKVEDVDANSLIVTDNIIPSDIPRRLRESEISLSDLRVNLNTIWVIFAGSLVFFMNAGFAMLETGFSRSSNNIPVLAKNLVVFTATVIIFWLFGFALMFGDINDEHFLHRLSQGGFLGNSGFLLRSPSENSPTILPDYKGVYDSLGWARIPLAAKFFFQTTFAATAATIVSGAIAERMKFKAYVLFVPLFILGSYSIVGHWVWGGGWLAQRGFWDFAGSTVVHSVGGWAALVGALLVGPRLNKYMLIKKSKYDRLSFERRAFPCKFSCRLSLPFFRIFREVKYFEIRSDIMQPSSLNLATLGCFILWLGWFGFNAGSTLEANGYAISHILINTAVAGASGGLGALIGAWFYLDRPILSYLINGILCGCVSVTAACAYVSLPSAVIVGLIGGILVIFLTVILEKLRLDDPVGAVAVHLGGGIWGTLAVGLFSEGPDIYSKYGIQEGPGLGFFLGGGVLNSSLLPQLIGIFWIGVYCFISSLLIWGIVRLFMPDGLRVSHQDEMRGTSFTFGDRQ